MDMAKKVSAWYLHSGRSKKSEYVVKLLKIGKAASISEAVSREKKQGKWLGESKDGITVKRVGTASVVED